MGEKKGKKGEHKMGLRRQHGGASEMGHGSHCGLMRVLKSPTPFPTPIPRYTTESFQASELVCYGPPLCVAGPRPMFFYHLTKIIL